jgi:hypothetical protein
VPRRRYIAGKTGTPSPLPAPFRPRIRFRQKLTEAQQSAGLTSTPTRPMPGHDGARRLERAKVLVLVRPRGVIKPLVREHSLVFAIFGQVRFVGDGVLDAVSKHRSVDTQAPVKLLFKKNPTTRNITAIRKFKIAAETQTVAASTTRSTIHQKPDYPKYPINRVFWSEFLISIWDRATLPTRT